MLEAAALATAEPVPPFADERAGADYFLSDLHVRTLVSKICAALGKGGIVLMSGEPPADGGLVTRQFEAYRENGYRATLLRCRPGMVFADLVQGYCHELEIAEADGDEQDTEWRLLTHLLQEARRGVIRVLVIDNADALDDVTSAELVRFISVDEPNIMRAVLLGTPSGLAKFESAPPDGLSSTVVARLFVQRLEREEIGPFIDHQLRGYVAAEGGLLSSETVASIAAAAANGDPALVNRMARLALSREEPAAAPRATGADPSGPAAVTPAPPPSPAPSPSAARTSPALAEIRRRIKAQNPMSRLRIVSAMRDRKSTLKIAVGAATAFGIIVLAGAAIAPMLHRSNQPSQAADIERAQPAVEQPAPAEREASADRPAPAVAPLAPTEAPQASSGPKLQRPIAEVPPTAAETPASANSPDASTASGDLRSPSSASEINSPDGAARPAPTESTSEAAFIAREPGAPPVSAPRKKSAASPSVTPATNGYRLQLGAVRTPEAADHEWERLKARHADLLGSLQYHVQRVDLGSRGAFYRIQAGPLADKAQAERQCVALKRRGEGCIAIAP